MTLNTCEDHLVTFAVARLRPGGRLAITRKSYEAIILCPFSLSSAPTISQSKSAFDDRLFAPPPPHIGTYMQSRSYSRRASAKEVVLAGALTRMMQ